MEFIFAVDPFDNDGAVHDRMRCASARRAMIDAGAPMLLSYELFKQIVEQLRADDRSEREKRVEPRVGLSCEASLVMRGKRGSDAPATERILVRDLSRSGVGLVLSERMPVNRSIMLELPSRTGSFWIMCTTVYCEELDDALFKVGARHTRVLDPEEVKRVSIQMNQSVIKRSDQADRIRVMILD